MPAATPVSKDASAGHRQCGELRLNFRRTSVGKTVLRECFRSGLFHVGKGYYEDDRMVLQILNPTAGLFEHDRAHAEITVGASARACLLSPSSTQVYQMPGDGYAQASQRVVVEDRASLVFLPRWSVLHEGARLRQHTAIHLSADASLVYLDQISAGRVAHGEFLEFQSLRSDLEIYRGGRLVTKERWHAGKNVRRWIWSCHGQSCGYLASLYLCAPRELPRVEALHDALAPGLKGEGALGITRLQEDFYMLRVIAPSNRAIASILAKVSALLPAQLRFPEVFTRTY